MNLDLERGMRDLDPAEVGFLSPRCGEHLVRERYEEGGRLAAACEAGLGFDMFDR